MYSSAREYAEIIKAEDFEYAAEPDDLEYRKVMLRDHYGSQFKSMKYDLNLEFTPTRTKYQHILDILHFFFCNTLPKEYQERFAERFYYTTVDNRRMYAQIKRSPDKRFYALFISSSLITILHKLGKLMLAACFPNRVVSCSRYPDEKVNRKQIVGMLAETYGYFKETKLPLGPMIILEGSVELEHRKTLAIQEKLLAYHEIAHVLNGDMEADADENQILSSDYPNLSYQREYYADRIGFGLLFREERHYGSLDEKSKISILSALITLFHIQYDLQGAETTLYPHPHDRLFAIIKCYYGEASADIILKEVKRNVVPFMPLPELPKFESKEIEMVAQVEQRLSAFFFKL